MEISNLTKRAIVNLIITSAYYYKKYLLGRTFMYVFNNRYIEVIFKKNNFMHLTGVKCFIHSKEFYNYAIRHKLQPHNIIFDHKHPYIFCIKKLQHLNVLATITSSKCYILENIKTGTATYEFGNTNMKFTVLFCRLDNKDINSDKKYIIKSLRDGDCLNKARNNYEVDYVFSKDSGSNKYSEIKFINKNCSYKLSKEILMKLNSEIINKLGYNITDLK